MRGDRCREQGIFAQCEAIDPEGAVGETGEDQTIVAREPVGIEGTANQRRDASTVSVSVHGIEVGCTVAIGAEGDAIARPGPARVPVHPGAVCECPQFAGRHIQEI